MPKINLNLQKALNIIKKSNSSKEKKKKLNVGAALADMQEYVDNTDEKKDLFFKVLAEVVDEDSGKKIIDKGVVVYAKRVKTISNLIEFIKSKDINVQCKKITGVEKTHKRKEVEDWFHDNPERKIVFISDAGGASLNLNPTDELILYTVPTAYRKFRQVIGRIARMFGKFDIFKIRFIIVNGTIDEYSKELLSSRSTIEEGLLHCNSIPTAEYDNYHKHVFEQVRQSILWRRRSRKLKK